jgi:hypothetical protein
MRRLTAALFLAGCLGFQAWGQTPPPAPTSAAPAPVALPASPSESSQYPFDRFQEFSALVAGGPVPGTEDEIHIYRSGNLLRMEGRESRNYLITDLVKQETHGLAATGCLKYGYPYVRSYPFSLARPENKYERVPGREETVDGHVCQVEDVTISSPKLPAPVRIRLWEAKDLQGFPIKVETMSHRTIEYKNVVLGPQDPTLFVFPDKCEVLDPKTSTSVAPKRKPSSPQNRQSQ